MFLFARTVDTSPNGIGVDMQLQSTKACHVTGAIIKKKLISFSSTVYYDYDWSVITFWPSESLLFL